MKAATVAEPATVRVGECEGPDVGPGDVLVQMHTCGICGSDVEKVFGKYGQPSRRLGHEPAGIVKEVGRNVKGLAVGDRVFAHHHVPCYSCHHCVSGSETMCAKYYESNLLPCGLAEEFLVPAWNVTRGGILKLPDSVSFDEAAMIEPLACCIRAWRKIPYRRGDSVAVYGVGPTGVMHVMLADAYGIGKIFCIDTNRFRLDFASSLRIAGAIHPSDPEKTERITAATKHGVDIAVVATASLQALQDAIRTVRKGGTVMMFGVPAAGASLDLDVSQLYSREITLSTSYAASDSDTRHALEMISKAEVPVHSLITHKYPLTDAQKAFEHARAGTGAMKIVVTG